MRSMLTLLLLLPLPAWADPVQAGYAAYAAGLNVLNLDATIDVAPTQYRARLAYHTAGTFGFVVRGEQQTVVDGHFVEGRAVPHRFYSAGVMRGQTRVTQIDYVNGQPTVRQLLPPVDEERDPVLPARQSNTIDTVSAMAELILQVNQTGRCEGHAMTFDGRRLSELSARTVGTEFLPPYSRSSFSGNALHCAFDGRMLAGFLHDEDRAEQQRDQHGNAWFAAVTQGGPMIPVRLSFHTHWFGDATMFLTERQ